MAGKKSGKSTTKSMKMPGGGKMSYPKEGKSEDCSTKKGR